MQHADVAMYLAKVGHIGVVRYDPAQDDYDSDRLGAGRRAAPGAGQRRAGPALPAEADPERRVGARRRGPDPLEPPAARAAPARRVPPGRRADRPHRRRSPTGWWTRRCASSPPGPTQGLALSVAVNVSARNLSHAGFADRVQAALVSSPVPAGSLIVEITETALLTDVERATDNLVRLAACGVPVSVDDFGRGQTSLGYLSRLPLHELKIDRSFVTDLLVDGAHAAIVRSVVELSHNLGLVVVAEGVEDEATLARLRELACDLAQGYVLARPMPAAEVRRWLAGRRRARRRPRSEPGSQAT